MSFDDDRLKALEYDHPEFIPVSVGILPAAWMKYREELDRLVSAHPILFGPPRDREYDAVGGTYVSGKHVDVWGCVWENIHAGCEAIVIGHPVANREAVHSLREPEADAGFPHGFMYLRLQDLRGFEELMVDFAEEPPELQMLIDVVLRYNLRQAEKQLAGLQGTGQIVTFGDDLGMQNSLPMSPEKWRKYLKPCFAAIYRPYRQAEHYVYMHTDGHIVEIIPDLVECGVNVVNPQVRANGLEELARVCKEAPQPPITGEHLAPLPPITGEQLAGPARKGEENGKRVCVDLDLDRQMFPFCTPQEIDEHVREAVEVLGSPEGGLWLKAEIGDDVPLANIEAIFCALERYRGYFRS
ncbi:MAG TPA: uroporphyrinogen decarboxylase family protein [Armatimonadota bacterium]|nr:uroporphyrinogen decarboxylase family protein [Armatimonadota bacterium]